MISDAILVQTSRKTLPRKWSVEIERGGYIEWQEVEAVSADEARGIVNRTYGDAYIRAVSAVSAKS